MVGTEPIRLSRGEVIAYRLRSHHLDQRLPADRLLEAAGACAVQNSPPGSALLALSARVAEMTAESFDALVADDRTLLQTWAMRGAPFLFPTAEAAVFTSGVLPPEEDGRRQLVVGVTEALQTLDLGLDEVVDLAAEEIDTVLAGRRLAIDELGEELAERIRGRLTPRQQQHWTAPGPYGKGIPLGEAVVHFCLRILTLRGVVCLAERSGNKAPFVLVEEWLGAPLPQTDPEQARAALLRRYLRCYGPATRSDLAGWLGVRAGDVDDWWTPAEPDLVEIDVDGRRAWLPSVDVDALRSAEPVTGLRLLPAGDPYTQLRDRETILAKEHHRAVWRPTGAPGTVLADGRLVGTWRPRKQGRRLRLTVTSFEPIAHRGLLESEAEQVAGLRGAETVEIAYES